MAWKTINGRRYYYKSERVGGRVRSKYIGGGRMATLIATLDEFERNDRESMRLVDRAEREELEAEDRAVGEWFGGVQAVAEAAMVAAGFHKHKGQWRRQRT